jgi:antibiotic biosynthesis monooxygenase (ABM) superfamily enzyme
MHPAAAAKTKVPIPLNIHERALVTWAAIFPLVLAAQAVLSPLVHTWPAVLQVFAMTLVVVPAASYVVMPRLMALYARLTRR